MSRLQLALNVADIDAAVEFYTTLFDTAPAKRRPGYANFAVVDPPLKLVLFENPEATGTLNHLGVERESMTEVEQQASRLEAAGLALDVEADVVCCFARQDKHWVTGPDADLGPASGGGCCGTRGSNERGDDQVDQSATARGQ